MDGGWDGEKVGRVRGWGREGTGIGVQSKIVLKINKNSTMRANEMA